VKHDDDDEPATSMLTAKAMTIFFIRQMAEFGVNMDSTTTIKW
jgi:hypothetical protein